MAKKYDFRIIIRKAEFHADHVTVTYGSGSVYLEQCFELTMAEAVEMRQKLSAEEKRPHAATISMKYRDDRKPAGFAKIDTYIYGGR